MVNFKFKWMRVMPDGSMATPPPQGPYYESRYLEASFASEEEALEALAKFDQYGGFEYALIKTYFVPCNIN